MAHNNVKNIAAMIRQPKRSLEWHTLTSKTFSGDQATPTVNQNDENIMWSSKMYVYGITTDAPQLTAASVALQNYVLAGRTFSQRH